MDIDDAFARGVPLGPRRHPYTPEFRQQIVDLVRAGRDAQDLAREFEPSSPAIRNWVADADRRDGRREPKPTAADVTLAPAERDELARLRRENKQLRLERRVDDLLARATTGDLVRAVQDKIRRARDRLLAFALFLGQVEPTDTACERDLRPAVIQRKVTNGYRSSRSAGGEADDGRLHGSAPSSPGLHQHAVGCRREEGRAIHRGGPALDFPVDERSRTAGDGSRTIRRV